MINDFNRSGSPYNPSTSTLVSSQAGISNLYNGNISSWTLQTDTISANYAGQMGFKYRYDQLNRIKKEDYNSYASGAWSDPANSYDNTYTYDGNGNILTMTRKGIGNDRDVLTAHHIAGKNQLEYVDDAAASGNYSVDIDDQGANNYLYTKIGERAKDVEGGIDTITWTVYRKMKSLRRNNGDSLIFVYDAMNKRVMKTVKPASGTPAVTYYVRDAQGNILTTYERTTSGASYIYKQKEVDIYGSDRIGIYKPDLIVRTRDTSGAQPGSCISCTDKYWWTVNTNNLKGLYTRSITKKEYELKDHLGNVRATVSDRKNSDSTASILSYTHYYAFGTELTGKVYNATSYAYGYNAKLKDDEVFNVSGGFYDYGERGMDARGVPIFLTPDPLTGQFPYYSPYQYAGNMPIVAIDLDGLEDIWIHTVKFADGLEIKQTIYKDDDNYKATRRLWAKEMGIPLRKLPKDGALYTMAEQEEPGAPLTNVKIRFTPTIKINPTKTIFELVEVQLNRTAKNIGKLEAKMRGSSSDPYEGDEGLRKMANDASKTSNIVKGAGIILTATVGPEVGVPVIQFGSYLDLASETINISLDVKQGKADDAAVRLGATATGFIIGKAVTNSSLDHVRQVAAEQLGDKVVEKVEDSFLRDKTKE